MIVVHLWRLHESFVDGLKFEFLSPDFFTATDTSPMSCNFDHDESLMSWIGEKRLLA